MSVGTTGPLPSSLLADDSRLRINSMPAQPDSAAAGSALSASASAVSWTM
ncbi:hypothetical protein IU450_21455 [Nocardia abscessus]|nr:hypothetical protein [Nocardia abscessus]MBF6338441.1 hypothetical protein [Nocardia abscessus]